MHFCFSACAHALIFCDGVHSRIFFLAVRSRIHFFVTACSYAHIFSLRFWLHLCSYFFWFSWDRIVSTNFKLSACGCIFVDYIPFLCELRKHEFQVFIFTNIFCLRFSGKYTFCYAFGFILLITFWFSWDRNASTNFTINIYSQIFFAENFQANIIFATVVQT